MHKLATITCLAMCLLSVGCTRWEIDRATKLTAEFEGARAGLYRSENAIRRLHHEASLIQASLVSARERSVETRQQREQSRTVLTRRGIEVGQLRRAILLLCQQPENDGRYRNTKHLFYYALDLRDRKEFQSAGIAFYEYYCQERMSEDGLLGLAFAGECFAFTNRTAWFAWSVRALRDNQSSMNAKTRQFLQQLEKRLPEGHLGRVDELYRKLAPAEESEAAAEQDLRLAEARDDSVQKELRDLVDQQNQNEDSATKARMDKRQATARLESFISGAKRQIARLQKHAERNFEAGVARDGLAENAERARELLSRSE